MCKIVYISLSQFPLHSNYSITQMQVDSLNLMLARIKYWGVESMWFTQTLTRSSIHVRITERNIHDYSQLWENKFLFLEEWTIAETSAETKKSIAMDQAPRHQFVFETLTYKRNNNLVSSSRCCKHENVQRNLPKNPRKCHKWKNLGKIGNFRAWYY